MIRGLLIYLGGIFVFILGMFLYGIFLDLRKTDLDEIIKQKKIVKIFPTRLVVNKMDYKMHLYIDTILVKTYNIVLGGNPKHKKKSKFDRFTPVGNYFICDKRETSGLGKILILNYPTIEDGLKGLKEGLITEEEFNKIKKSINIGTCPPSDTKLGGLIKIHGNGRFDLFLRNLPFVFNWTDGSIAVNNSEIEELYEICPIGTPVIIY